MFPWRSRLSDWCYPNDLSQIQAVCCVKQYIFIISPHLIIIGNNILNLSTKYQEKENNQSVKNEVVQIFTLNSTVISFVELRDIIKNEFVPNDIFSWNYLKKIHVIYYLRDPLIIQELPPRSRVTPVILEQYASLIKIYIQQIFSCVFFLRPLLSLAYLFISILKTMWKNS